MKAGLTTSVILHGAALAICLFSLRAPSAFEVANVESLPVDIVPVSSLTQIQQGDKKATMHDKPAPKPTERPDVVPDAQKIGDNTLDTEKPPTPDQKPRPVDAASAAAPAPAPTAKPKDEDTPKPPDPPKPTPATEVAPQPTPKEVVKPDPVKEPAPAPQPVKEPAPAPKPPEPKAVETPDPVKPDAVADAIAADKPSDEVPLPDSAPAPEAKPTPASAAAETAKAPDRKDSDKPVKEASSKPQSDDKALDDKISALLSKEKPSGGGAKRSTQQASLGGDKTTSGNTLSQSEMDSLRGQVEKCWNIPAGAEDAENLKVSVKFKLDRTGAVDGPIDIISGGGSDGVQRAAAESARRAVARCAPYNLPAEKYDSWSEVVVNFDPSDMF